MAWEGHMGSRLEIDSTLTEGEIALDGTQTRLVFKINSRNMGVCLSEQRNHAEINLIALLQAWQEGQLSDSLAGALLAEQATSARGNGTCFIDVFITRSPCENCATKLIAWASGLHANAKIRLRLFCLTIYRGESNRASIDNIKKLKAQERIEVYRWDVENMARALDVDSLMVLQVANGNAMNEATGFRVTNLWSRLGEPNLRALDYMRLDDPTNFHVTS
jgi:hypothetical protein